MQEPYYQDVLFFKGTIGFLYVVIIILKRKGVPVAVTRDGRIVLVHPYGNAEILAHDMGDGVTRVAVIADDLEWTIYFEPQWRIVVEVLTKADLVLKPMAATQEQEPKQIETKKEDSPIRPFGWAKKQKLECNQWLLEQYFERGRTRLSQLQDEWLRIRKNRDGLDAPQDASASMRAAISDEKERRSIGKA